MTELGIVLMYALAAFVLFAAFVVNGAVGVVLFRIPFSTGAWPGAVAAAVTVVALAVYAPLNLGLNLGWGWLAIYLVAHSLLQSWAVARLKATANPRLLVPALIAMPWVIAVALVAAFAVPPYIVQLVFQNTPTSRTVAKCVERVSTGFMGSEGFSVAGKPEVLRKWKQNYAGLIEVNLHRASDPSPWGQPFYCTVGEKGDIIGISDVHPDPGAPDLRK